MTVIYGAKIEDYFTHNDVSLKVISSGPDHQPIQMLGKPYYKKDNDRRVMSVDLAIFGKVDDIISFNIKMETYLGYKFILSNANQIRLSSGFYLPERGEGETDQVVVISEKSDHSFQINRFDGEVVKKDGRYIERSGKIQLVPYDYITYPRGGDKSDPNWTLNLLVQEVMAYERNGVTYKTEPSRKRQIRMVGAVSSSIDGKKSRIEESDKKEDQVVDTVSNVKCDEKYTKFEFAILTYKNDSERQGMIKYTAKPSDMD